MLWSIKERSLCAEAEYGMSKIFCVQDRLSVLDFIISVAKECPKIVALIQVGSGAEGFHDERSDLDFVVAFDSNDSMTEVIRAI